MTENYPPHLVLLPSAREPEFMQLDMLEQIDPQAKSDHGRPHNIIPFPVERTNTYQEYLQSREWQEQRTEALQRARHRCQVCNTRHQFQVHHRTYYRERPDDLTVLCRPCHELFHRYGRLVRCRPQTG